MRPSAGHAFRRTAAGFTYVGLLMAVVLLGLALAGTGAVWRTSAQREREHELLYIGRAFQAAIASYYAVGGRQYPQTLEDLVDDKRGPEPRHHLRRIYADPMTGRPDWMVLRVESLGITGIASSSTGMPIKKDNFPDEEEAFKEAQTYRDWQFIYVPRNGRRQLMVNPGSGN